MSYLLCFLLVAAPPQIRVEPGKTIIVQGGTTITLTADGGIKILGPSLDLVVPGDGVAPVPIPPQPNALADSLRSIYGGLQEQTKAADAKALAAVYRGLKWDGDTVSTIAEQLRGIVPPGRFSPMRERIGAEVTKVLGSDPGAPLDAVKDAGKRLFADLAKILGDLR